MSQKTNELYHYGILGMKWGVRRYQNRDGSLTNAGRKRAAKLESDYKSLTGRNLKKKVNNDNKIQKQNKPKSVKEMSDAELKEKTNRMTLENNYNIAKQTMNRLNPEKVSLGKKIVKHVSKQVLLPAVTEWGKEQTKNLLFELSKNNNKNKNK